jgi:hypothetical protein
MVYDMLNQALYDKLVSAFGEVRVTNEGQPFLFNKSMNVRGESELVKQQSGEEYRVCCPVCGDTRFRLYINHTYGQDSIIGYPTSRLIKCQNENCEQNIRAYENAGEVLRRMLGGYLRDVITGKAPKVRVNTQEAKKLPPLSYPDNAITVDKLEPGNPAFDYLVLRTFDPEIIGKKYGVGYTTDYVGERAGKSYNWLSGRMFIPCGDGGWQARDLEGYSSMKYFTSPGWQKSRTVYNLDTARRQPKLCVLCEGVTDVWRVGDRGVAIFGKDLSVKQCDDISSNFAAVAVMLDADAFEGLKPSGVKAIVDLQKRSINAFRVLLPTDRDPAECTTKELWNLINAEAIKRGVEI